MQAGYNSSRRGHKLQAGLSGIIGETFMVLGIFGEFADGMSARWILRDLFGGEIRLVPVPDGGLTAHWNLHREALLKAVEIGSGGVMCTVPTVPQSARLK